MRVLVCTTFATEGVARHRAAALERLGHDVVRVDTDALMPRLTRAGNWLRIRTQLGPSVAALNSALVETARGTKFDVVWCDKPIFIRPETVRLLRDTGARVVSFNPDNPFAPRCDPGWRLFLKALAEYDVHVVNTAACIPDYLKAGARRAYAMPPFFEPTAHFPPPEGWSDADRDIDVGFIGAPYDDRPAFIRALRADHGITVRVWGGRWDRVFTPAEQAVFVAGGFAAGDAYTRLIWRTKICLGFVTHANCDTYARRWFEIAGCGAFLLAEPTEDGRACFRDGEEAVFFTDVAACAALIRRYLPDEAARDRIAAAGRARALASGYDTDSRMREALRRVMEGA
jgi:spore maturation protein CgeB